MVKFTFLAVASLAVMSSLAPQQAEAHSWLECVDWRHNKGVDKNDWRTSKGWCAGFARRFPVKNPKTAKVAFGLLDNTQYSRHFRQNLRQNDQNPSPCSNGHNGIENGINETRDLKGAYGGQWGPMTVTHSGARLCLRWPAKNHADPREYMSSETFVIVSLSEKPNSADPSQDELDKMIITKGDGLKFRNCNRLGDNGKKDQNTRPCGGCIDIPKRKPGIYLLQWRWTLNKGRKNGRASPLDDETYTSCADIQIK